MLSFSISRCRGAIIVFVLMGLIAVLALTVVFLSRAGREDDRASLDRETAPTAGMATTSLYDESPTTAPLAGPEPTAPAVIPPPPATPPTPTPRS